MNGHATGCREFLVAYVTLEVLGFLMLHQDFLIVELPIAIIAPHLLYPLTLLLPHQLPLFFSVFLFM